MAELANTHLRLRRRYSAMSRQELSEKNCNDKSLQCHSERSISHAGGEVGEKYNAMK